ncbi:hypothetical protein H072_4898 [Dactylellina haptotyla CBS 200.50]|uniref:Elongation factor 1-gamma n=1 Tax=Dactylellina haptotyla (strain CBS 200.50) TaxID=1284197 RepID=S8AE19_DACHA|nr:hypothetical protein H072_4898 [Dactylellina haptotyla CBS 200.50]
MSFGTLYSNAENSRTVGILSIAKENGLDVKLEEVFTGDKFPAELTSKSPLKKIPFFEQGDFLLTESLAIAIYITSQNEKTTLLGKSKQEYAQILRWMSFGTSEVLNSLASWFRPLVGLDPYNKRNVDTAQATALAQIAMIDSHLLTRTYLVGERISAADFYLAGIVSKGFKNVFDAPFRTKYPNFTRWWATIANHTSYAGKFEFIEEAVKYTPPAKAPKAAPAPKATQAAKPKAAEPDEEEEDKPAPKPKHPIEALGRAELVLDDWKRKYSNSDTRPEALPWFWEHYNAAEWSLWKVDYKYNEELTQVFMSSNLIGGFFARLEASRKYIFGSCSVYGESNNSIIQGAFFIRGQDHLAAFDVAPDWESYEFTKLDPTSEEDKEFIASMWAWDKPITVNGKEYPHADGKVFK